MLVTGLRQPGNEHHPFCLHTLWREDKSEQRVLSGIEETEGAGSLIAYTQVSHHFQLCLEKRPDHLYAYGPIRAMMA